ncbi:hypothetical protein KJ608_01420 [Patescibacteria group bacterium]|nr:hypothetical protein [Patescibacteria group bacterium]
MEGIIPEEQLKQESPLENEVHDDLAKLLFRKRYIYIIVAMAVLFLFFFPIGEKSLIERLAELGKQKAENLVPNPSFEKGSGDEPAGWTTKSKYSSE